MPFLILSVIIVALDRILKFVIFKNFCIGSSSPLIKGILYITPTYNKGAAFGLFRESAPCLFIAASVIAIVFILFIILVKRPGSVLLSLGSCLILAGACGNLIDRIAYGHVLDFIDFKVWPVFNIADSAITIGTVLVLFYLVVTKRKT
ncbi:MAG: signal peptidase II [Candidatus Omnitrophica bacterium]|nr:signal peptidase II [Candidatus Omnitrophota bacterium]